MGSDTGELSGLGLSWRFLILSICHLSPGGQASGGGVLPARALLHLRLGAPSKPSLLLLCAYYAPYTGLGPFNVISLFKNLIN